MDISIWRDVNAQNICLYFKTFFNKNTKKKKPRRVYDILFEVCAPLRFAETLPLSTYANNLRNSCL